MWPNPDQAYYQYWLLEKNIGKQKVKVKLDLRFLLVNKSETQLEGIIGSTKLKFGIQKKLLSP